MNMDAYNKKPTVFKFFIHQKSLNVYDCVLLNIEVNPKIMWIFIHILVVALH